MAVERHLRALEAAVAGPMTLGELAGRVNENGRGLLVVAVCLPFLQPLPMGGLSTIIGPLVALEGIQMARGTPFKLPTWIANRRLEARTLKILIGSARRFFAITGKLTRPRWRAVAASPRAAGIGIAVSGALLSLPFPIPLSNVICAAPATLLALAVLEEDGLLAALGWLAFLAALAFHTSLFALTRAALMAAI